jgi:pyruvate formate lyase activating enzyme
MEACDYCGKCEIFCPNDAREICGREYTVKEVMQEILKDQSLYINSGGGVTFSGGECMLQIDFLEELLIECKKCGIHTAVDTAGCVPFEYFKRIIPYTDLFLYDVKCIDSEKHKRYTGVANEMILDNLGNLLSTDKEVWIRIPIIPTVNDSEEEIHSIKKLLSNYRKPEKIEMLPYHAMGEHKYEALGMELHKFIS